jgi:hypothetical protein
MLITATPDHSPLAEMAAGRHTTVLPTETDDTLAVAVVMLQALHRLGVGPDVDPEGVARALDDVAVDCSPHRDISNNAAKALAISLADSLPLVWGGSVLAARAARRVVEAMRRATGRPALSADADHLMPVLAAATARDVFADPYDDDPGSARPSLLILDDGTQEASIREQRGRLTAMAENRGARVESIQAADGSETARYAALLSRGLYAAAYLGVGLGADAGEDGR